MTNQIPDIITQYLRVAGSADPADADQIVACFTSDGEVIDEGETRRGRPAIRQWWEGPGTTYGYTVQVRRSRAWATIATWCSPGWPATFPAAPPTWPTASPSATASSPSSRFSPGGRRSLVPPRPHKGPSPSGPRTARIVERVRAIPKGFVRTYADIEPAAPRLVGHVLATTHENLPWHRVVRADGSAPMGASQLELLRREGVPLRGDRVDLSQARLPG